MPLFNFRLFLKSTLEKNNQVDLQALDVLFSTNTIPAGRILDFFTMTKAKLSAFEGISKSDAESIIAARNTLLNKLYIKHIFDTKNLSSPKILGTVLFEKLVPPTPSSGSSTRTSSDVSFWKEKNLSQTKLGTAISTADVMHLNKQQQSLIEGNWHKLDFADFVSNKFFNARHFFQLFYGQDEAAERDDYDEEEYVREHAAMSLLEEEEQQNEQEEELEAESENNNKKEDSEVSNENEGEDEKSSAAQDQEQDEKLQLQIQKYEEHLQILSTQIKLQQQNNNNNSGSSSQRVEFWCLLVASQLHGTNSQKKSFCNQFVSPLLASAPSSITTDEGVIAFATALDRLAFSRAKYQLAKGENSSLIHDSICSLSFFATSARACHQLCIAIERVSSFSKMTRSKLRSPGFSSALCRIANCASNSVAADWFVYAISGLFSLQEDDDDDDEEEEEDSDEKNKRGSECGEGAEDGNSDDEKEEGEGGKEDRKKDDLIMKDSEALSYFQTEEFLKAWGKLKIHVTSDFFPSLKAIHKMLVSTASPSSPSPVKASAEGKGEKILNINTNQNNKNNSSSSSPSISATAAASAAAGGGSSTPTTTAPAPTPAPVAVQQVHQVVQQQQPVIVQEPVQLQPKQEEKEEKKIDVRDLDEEELAELLRKNKINKRLVDYLLDFGIVGRDFAQADFAQKVFTSKVQGEIKVLQVSVDALDELQKELAK